MATGVETFRVIGSHGYPLDEEFVRELAGRSWDRSYDPDGWGAVSWPRPFTSGTAAPGLAPPRGPDPDNPRAP